MTDRTDCDTECLNRKWIPMESNPIVMNQMLWSIGVDPLWQIIDVCGLERDSLDFIARPVAALILCSQLFYDVQRINDDNHDNEDSDIYFMRQTIGNACGTIALIHAIANNRHQIELKDNCLVKRFLDSTHSMTAEERGVKLSLDSDMCLAHRMAGESALNQTTIPNDSMPISHHYITLVEINSNIYELDGRLTRPYNRGRTSKQSFVYDAANVCQQYIAKDPNNLNFSVLALVKNQL